jgi:hypothetical protein
MIKDSQEFQAKNSEFLDQYVEMDRSENLAGHDFWLTRNGHGAGFWDRGLGELGDALTQAAKSFGQCDLYVTDDGAIAIY